MRIYKEITAGTEWLNYLKENLWGGAKKRWDDMTAREQNYLCQYMSEIEPEDMAMTETEVNDFI